ncbi:MAG: hypothetical protein AAGJ73_14450 [Pseudomonadota bacterium]
MNTPTHLIAAFAVLARPQSPRRNLAVVAGALAPDVWIYVFFTWAQFFTAYSMEEIWRDVYWTQPWQFFGAISNSAPVALALAMIAAWRKSELLSAFAFALLIHAALDFPVHADDAHRHFWPLTDWRFISPVSYWDADHHGTLGALIEAAVFFAAAIVLWRRFPARWARGTLAACLPLYAVAMAGAMIVFSG